MCLAKKSLLKADDELGVPYWEKITVDVIVSRVGIKFKKEWDSTNEEIQFLKRKQAPKSRH